MTHVVCVDALCMAALASGTFEETPHGQELCGHHALGEIGNAVHAASC